MQRTVKVHVQRTVKGGTEEMSGAPRKECAMESLGELNDTELHAVSGGATAVASAAGASGVTYETAGAGGVAQAAATDSSNVSAVNSDVYPGGVFVNSGRPRRHRAHI